MFLYVGNLLPVNLSCLLEKLVQEEEQKHVVLTVEQKLEIWNDVKSCESCLKIEFCKSFTLEN